MAGHLSTPPASDERWTEPHPRKRQAHGHSLVRVLCHADRRLGPREQRRHVLVLAVRSHQCRHLARRVDLLVTPTTARGGCATRLDVSKVFLQAAMPPRALDRHVCLRDGAPKRSVATAQPPRTQPVPRVNGLLDPMPVNKLRNWQGASWKGVGVDTYSLCSPHASSRSFMYCSRLPSWSTRDLNSAKVWSP
jgi:hypothetical protein